MSTVDKRGRRVAYSRTDLADKGFSIVPSEFWGRPVLEGPDGTLSCPGFEGPTFPSQAGASPWDVFAIDLDPSIPCLPGIANVTVRKSRDVDKKKAAGGDGARFTFHGIDPAMVEIRLTIWTPEQLRYLNIIWPMLFPPPVKVNTQETVTSFVDVQKARVETTTVDGRQVTTTIPAVKKKVTKTKQRTDTLNTTHAYDCTHPKLTTHGIKSLIFVGAEGPDEGSIAGSKVFTMHAVEFMVVTPKIVTTETPVASLGSLNDAPTYAPPGKDPRNLGPF